jgi:hypothetical protein
VGVAYAGVECSERAASRRSAQVPPLHAILAAPHHRFSLIWIPRKNSLRFSWAAPSATTADAASHLVGSSCTRLNQRRRCRLHVIVREFNLSEPNLAEVELWSIRCRVRWREAWRVQLTFLAALALPVQPDSDTQENSLRFPGQHPVLPLLMRPVTSSAPRVRD